MITPLRMFTTTIMKLGLFYLIFHFLLINSNVFNPSHDQLDEIEYLIRNYRRYLTFKTVQNRHVYTVLFNKVNNDYKSLDGTVR